MAPPLSESDPTDSALPDPAPTERFERALDAFLRAHAKNQPALLAESIRYSAMGGGKRVRPRIVQAVGHALGVPVPTVDALAIALELIHTYTLIHDDLPCMDNDDVRRGRPTNHRQFNEATALLAGDALIPLAFEAIAKIQDPVAPPTALRRAIVALARASGGPGVIAGQLDETTFTADADFDALLDIFRKKTGALFGLAFELPATFSSALGEGALTDPAVKDDSIKDQAVRDHAVVDLHAVGESIGIAFQIADDLEDPWPPGGREQAPRHHVRAHLTDAESIAWIEQERDRTLARIPAVTAARIGPIVRSLFTEILEKCVNHR